MFPGIGIGIHRQRFASSVTPPTGFKNTQWQLINLQWQNISETWN
jgi:hypothetical protein